MIHGIFLNSGVLGSLGTLILEEIQDAKSRSSNPIVSNPSKFRFADSLRKLI